IASLDMPVILERLCRLTAEVLRCDFSHTWLWQPDDAAFVAVSGHGDAPELWESFRVLKLSRASFGPLLPRLEEDGIVQFDVSNFESADPTVSPPVRGITMGLLMALRRGAEMFGIHTAGYRGRADGFTWQQQRIARGIAQLASLALENARLVEEL